MKKRYQFRYSVFLVVLLLTLAGCTSSGDKVNTPSNTSAASEASQTPKKDDKIVIGFSMDTLQEERWKRDRDYFVDRATELGAEVLVQSANSDDAKQISQAENLISQGVDVLVVIAHNSEASAAIVEKAHAAGIKVLAYDRLINNSDLDMYIVFDSIKIGEMQAKTIVEKVPKGKFVLIEGSETDANAHVYKEGQMNILKPYIERGDIKIVYEQWTKDWSPTVALANMENALSANNNDIDAVIAANDGTAGAVIQALAAQKMAGKIPVSGQDAELAALQRIVEGTQTMTVYTPLNIFAGTAAELAVKMAKNENIESNATVNNGKVDVPSVFLDPILVTKENIDETVIADGFHSKEDVYKNVK